MPSTLWPYVFLFLGVVSVLLTLNARWPARRGYLIAPSFFAALLTAELPQLHLGFQLVATAALVRVTDLSSWPSRLGLGLSALSCLGLAWMTVESLRAKRVVESALAELRLQEQPEREPVPLTAIAMPFWLRDAKVERIGNLRYGPYGRRNFLDVYRPRSGAKNAPVILQIHGGAWVVGDKRQQGLPLMLHMAKKGFVCVAINYRLSPRSRFPDHLVDCKRALAWIRENIAEYGGDPSRIIVTGGSAGGHLAALVALTANDPRYQPGFEEVDTSVRACVPVYAPYDLAELLGHRKGTEAPMVERLARWVMGATVDEAPELYREASPLALVHENAPPFFVIHGTHDNLVPVAQARRFVETLRTRTKAQVAYVELAGAPHAFDVFHSLRTETVVRSIERFATWAAS